MTFSDIVEKIIVKEVLNVINIPHKIFDKDK